MKILTLFPEMFPGPLGFSVVGNALKENLWNFEAIDIRDYAKDKRKTVDDTPYGGGAGMVIRPDILSDAIDKNIKKGSKILHMSPRGELLSQKKIYELAKLKDIAIICGRFEGIDQRVFEEYQIDEISMGDFILSGGEIAAYALIDSCVRTIDGVLGNRETLKDESFSIGGDELLEYPLYTKPYKWRGKIVPEILISGHHEKIEKWRFEQAEKITKERRKDLWEKYSLKKEDKND